MNPRPPNDDSADSASPSAEQNSLPPSPPREKLKRWRALQLRLRAAGGHWPASWTHADSTPGMDDAPVKPRRRWSPWVRRLLTASAVLAVLGLTAAACIWKHYSDQAAKYDLAWLQRLSQGTRVLDRNGQFVGTMFSQDRKFVKVSEVPQQFIDALLATEDSRFYSHRGIDVKAIARAMSVNVSRMSVRQGASTITQQLARQAFELRGRTLQRKILESFVANRLENAYSKSEILEFYLNQIYLGSSFYGVGAAARGYFGKDVKDLNLEEAAMIAGIIKAPVSFSPYRSLSSAQRVRNLTLDRMAALGKIDAATRDAAKAQPVQVLAEDERAYRPEYLIAAVEKEMESKTAPSERPVEVSLTVDLELQSQVQDALKKHLERVEAEFANEDAAAGAPAQPLQGAVVVLNNHSGEILAAIGGRDYRTSPFDRAMKGQRPAGTAFLPLTYAAVFSVSPDVVSSWVVDGPLDNRRVMMGGTEGIVGEWGGETQRNVYAGQVSTLDALYRGRTGAAVRLGYQAGIDAVKEKLQACGFGSPLRNQASLLLGSSEVRVVELARAYAAIAAGGKLPASPPLVTAVQDPDGDTSESPVEVGSSTAFTGPAALAVRGTMVAAMQRPEIQNVLRQHGLTGRGLAGFGGTAYGFTDAWFVGSNEDITCAVWMGYDVARSMGKEAWAVKTVLPLWAQVMAATPHAGGKGWLIAADTPVLCLKSGAVATKACRENSEAVLVQAGPIQTDAGGPSCAVHEPAVRVLAAIPVEPKEVSKLSLKVAKVTADKEIRSVKPLTPVLVGPDIYGALGPAEAPPATATTAE